MGAQPTIKSKPNTQHAVSKSQNLPTTATGTRRTSWVPLCKVGAGYGTEGLVCDGSTQQEWGYNHQDEGQRPPPFDFKSSRQAKQLRRTIGKGRCQSICLGCDKHVKQFIELRVRRTVWTQCMQISYCHHGISTSSDAVVPTGSQAAQMEF